VAGSLRLDLAQYREMAAFAQFGSDLDEATQAQLVRGSRTIEVLKQGQYVPMKTERQVMILWVATQGYLDSLPLDQVKAFEEGFNEFMDQQYADVVHSIGQTRQLSDDVVAKLRSAVEKFKSQFAAGGAK
jgi:F-type H+-transporting ATPase subunit alpha